jgi:hypothetical protein
MLEIRSGQWGSRIMNAASQGFIQSGTAFGKLSAKPFRLISLHKSEAQPLWNYILAKKGGGHPCSKVLL